MPELPDIVVYQEHLARRIVGARLVAAQVSDPNLLRTAEPPLDRAIGTEIRSIGRMGKRLVLHNDCDLALVLHLMIAGRLHWRGPGEAPFRRRSSAAFTFSSGTLTLTEASTRKRASLHVVRTADLPGLDPGGLELAHASLVEFRTALLRESHTLKRALCDPRNFSGIGNAYSDEILHRARLSPLRLTGQLEDREIEALFDATRAVLREWTERLREQTGERFPEGVTAFRPDMAVHGRYRKPCPVCGTPIQRIRYVANEVDYCPRCQTGGRLLADRGLSRLLRGDWPRTLEELEERFEAHRRPGPAAPGAPRSRRAS
jgi:formamidopyrimidine-DNA glycosylase